jgi:hypothetical protein
MTFLVGLLVLVLIVGLVLGLMIFAIRQITIIPEPFRGIAIAICCLIAVCVLIGGLTGQIPMPNLFGAGHR